MNFQYNDEQLNELMKKDKRMAELIHKVGKIEREIIPDLFSALVHAIISQQISTRQTESIWNSLKGQAKEVTPKQICSLSLDEFRKLGISMRKAAYIQRLAQRIEQKELDLDQLHDKSDQEVIEILSALPGIGIWTAQMLMIFSMNRMDVLSPYDRGILKGLRMVFHHREITNELFNRYRRRFSPYGSLASLYLWKVATGTVEGYVDLKKPSKEDMN